MLIGRLGMLENGAASFASLAVELDAPIESPSAARPTWGRVAVPGKQIVPSGGRVDAPGEQRVLAS